MNTHVQSGLTHSALYMSIGFNTVSTDVASHLADG